MRVVGNGRAGQAGARGSRAAYCHLCWTAAEPVLTCTASRASQDLAGLREGERWVSFASR
jgi:hypothetical protein